MTLQIKESDRIGELLTVLYFAKKIRLQYVFNEKSLVYNFQQAELQWLGDLSRQRRYPVPQKVVAEPNG